MKTALLGGLVGVGLLVTLAALFEGNNSEVYAERPYAQVGGDRQGLITSALAFGDQMQQLTLVDPATKAMAVYHVDAKNGKIVLKSVRNVHWDLQMLHFNGSEPFPDAMRALSEQ